MFSKFIPVMLLLFICSFSHAGSEHRQKIHNQRIENNIKSGKINESEAARLKMRQNRIEKKTQRFESTKQAAKSDGVITKFEKKRLVKQKANIKK